MLFFKSKKKSEIETFFEQKDVSIAMVIDAFRSASQNVKNKVAYNSVFKELFKNATKEEVIELCYLSFISSETALNTKKIILSDIFRGRVENFGLYAFIEHADDELILKHLKEVLQLIEEYDYPPYFDFSIKLDNYLTLQVKSQGDGEIVMSISDSHGVYYINLENIHTVSYYLDKIYINDIASQYSFENSSKFDSKRIKSLLEYLHAKSVANSKRCCVA